MKVFKLLFNLTFALVLIPSLMMVHPKTYAIDKEGELYSTAPLSKGFLGEKWRLGYVESDKFKDYQALLRAIIQGLSKLGWIEALEIPFKKDETDSKKLWMWLATEVDSDYLEFVADAYWSADNDNEEQRQKNIQAIFKRLNEEKDIDLMIGMGDKAGQDMATTEHQTNTVLGVISDPTDGIIKSAEDSGYDHIFTQVDLKFDKRQLELFHDIFGFKQLGITYEDSENGKKVARINTIYQMARERNFEIKRYTISNYKNPEVNDGVRELRYAHRYLAPRIDAMYLTINTALDDPLNLQKILEPLNKRKIVTFSQGAGNYVKHGVLMSVAAADWTFLGEFYAEKIAKILNGATPRQLKQRYRTPTSIALNLKVAENLGWEIPLEVLAAVDEFYQEIILVEEEEVKKNQEPNN